MDLTTFAATIKRLRSLVSRFDTFDRFTAGQWTESPIGDLFDLALNLLAPNLNDEEAEWLGDLIFASSVPSDEIENFYKEAINKDA